MESPNSVVYGNIVYNCGTHENLDHGIYFQNSSGTKLIKDNIVFNNLAYGFHGFTSGQQSLINTTLRRNTSFNNGTIATGYSERPDYLVGAGSGSPVIDEITMDSNYSFRNTVSQETADIGWHFGQAGGDLVFTDNHMVGTRFMNTWASVDSTPSNTQRLSFPGSGELVLVQPSDYDINRGNVIIYNWDLGSTVAVDLSTILNVGQVYHVKHVFDLWGSDVLTGTYGGGSVSFPMQAVSPPALLGRTYTTAPTPGPRFGAFVVTGD
jgi:parallel beta-helix repeat protein